MSSMSAERACELWWKSYLVQLDDKAKVRRFARREKQMRRAFDWRRFLKKPNRSGFRLAAVLQRCADDLAEFTSRRAVRDLELIIRFADGCTGWVLRAPNLSSECCHALYEAFTAVDDPFRLERAVRDDLVRLKNGPEKGMRAAFRRLRAYLASCNRISLDRDHWLSTLAGLPSDVYYTVTCCFLYALPALCHKVLLPLGLIKIEGLEEDLETEDRLLAFQELASIPHPKRRQVVREAFQAGRIPGDFAALVESDTWMQARCRLIRQAITIESYWKHSGNLPLTLSEVETLPNPYTGLPFDYQVLEQGYRLSSPEPDFSYAANDEMFALSTMLPLRYELMSLTVIKGDYCKSRMMDSKDPEPAETSPAL